MEGHATHFLDRLSRVSGPQTELALELYYEPEVFRSVLRSARVPHAYNRVAVSLHSEDHGPYLVASRDGDFITCLGSGMRVRHAYLVRHFRLISIMRSVPGFKERMEMAESLSGGGKNLSRILNLVTSKGKVISREDFLAISAMQKSMKGYLAYCWWQTGKDSIGVFNKLKLIKKKQKSFRNKNNNELHLYWNLFHGVGHFSLLFSMTGIHEIENVFKSNEDASRAIFGYFAYKNELSVFLKHIWSLSRMGDIGYAICKSFLLEPYGGPIWLSGLIGLSVIALFNRERIQEIKELFAATLQVFYIYDKNVFDGFAMGEPERLLKGAIDLLNNPDSAECNKSSEFAGKLLCEYGKRNELPAPYNWSYPVNVPENTANAFLMNAGLPLMDGRIFPALLQLIPWLSRCEAQDFYITKDFLKHVDLSWTPRAVKSLVQRQLTGQKANKAPKEPKKSPGRNNLCNCGSKKKYKKCCIGDEIYN